MRPMTTPAHASAETQIAMQVLPPPHNERDAAAMEQLLGTLAQLPSPVSLEIAAQSDQRRMLVRGAPAVTEHVAAALYAVYRQVDVERLPPDADPMKRFDTPGSTSLTVHLTTDSPDYVPLKTWREFEGNEPLDALLGAFDGLGQEELALSQVIVRGAAPAGWASAHLSRLAALKRRGYGADLPVPASHIIGWTLGAALIMVSAIGVMWAYAGEGARWWMVGPALALLAPLAVWCFTWQDVGWSRVLEDEAVAKLREQAFAVEVRLYATAQTEARARAILNRLISAYRLFDTTSGNQFRATPVAPALPGDLGRLPHTKPALLNVKEIAGLWHIPVGESLELMKRQAFERLVPLPSSVAPAQGAFIGVAEKGAQSAPVRLAPEALRRNLLIIGKTQHGKSTLMEHIAAAWMRDPDRSVLVVDPHGDLAHRMIGLLPLERAKDVIYLDLSDEARSAALNLLDASSGLSVDALAEDFVDVGRALWEDFWGPRMVVPLGMGLRALAHANQRRSPDEQFTILSLSDLLLLNLKARRAFLEAEVEEGERPDLRRYFDGEYALTSASQLEQVIAPVLSKTRAFERSAAIRRLVGQPHSTVRLYDAVQRRRIVILNANAGLLGDDLAGFLGSLLLNVMRRVVMRQTARPRAERVPVSVIADEFQMLKGVDFGALLGELQKNGGNFVLGTQSLQGLRRGDDGDAHVAQLLAGVDTKIVLQVNGEDAHYLVEHELDINRLRAESLINLPRFHAYVKTIDDAGQPLPAFSLRLAPPLTPDVTVAEAVGVGRAAYTLSAEAADQAVHRSLLRMRTEYAGAGLSKDSPQSQPEAAPPNAMTVISQAAALATSPSGASDLQRQLQIAAADPDRPRAQPPRWTTQRQTPGRDEDALAQVAAAITDRRPKGQMDGTPAAD
jgi:hypothetical protein